MLERSAFLFLMLLIMGMLSHWLRFFNPRAKPLSTISGFFFLFLFVLLIIGLRPVDTANDTGHYVYVYAMLYSFSTASETGQDYFGSTEPLFWIFAYLIKVAGASEQLFLVCSAVCSSIILLWSIWGLEKKSIDLNRALWLTLLGLFCTYSMAYMSNHMRASMAIPLTIAAFAFSTRNKLLAAGGALLLAVGFHNSAMLMIPVLLLGNKVNPSNSRKEKLLILVVLVGCLAVSNLAIATIQMLAPNFSGVVEAKVILYSNQQFEIQSIYTALNFWLILGHVLVFLLVGYGVSHLFAYYVLAISLLLSPIPILSDRYFAYVMPLLPLLMYLSLSRRFSVIKTTAIVTVFYAAVAVALINTKSVLYNLGMGG